MIDLLTVALFQAAAGDPVQSPPTAPADQVQAPAATPVTVQPQDVPRCRLVAPTGSRLNRTWDCSRTAAEARRAEHEQQAVNRSTERAYVGDRPPGSPPIRGY